MSSAHLKISEVRLKTLAIAAVACLVAGLALAQPPQRSGTPIQWLKGPVRINVGGGGGVTVAEVNIPPGYGFVGDAGARAVLTAMNNVPPNDLIGLIAPPEEKWVAIVQYAEVGYISNAGQDSLDARAVLEQIRAKIARQMKGIPQAVPFAAGDVDWEIPPAYDSGRHKLEWAVKIGAPGQSAVNRGAAFLGRRGILLVTFSLPNQPQQTKSDSLHPLNSGAGYSYASLNAVIDGISFKPGEGYDDHRAADPISPLGLAGLIIREDNNNNPVKADSFWTKMLAHVKAHKVLVGSGAAVMLAGGGWITLLLVRRFKRRHLVPSNGRHNGALIALNGANHHHYGDAQTNGNGKTNGQLVRRRRKQFNYNTFYTEVVMSLTRCGYNGVSGPVETEGDLPFTAVSNGANGNGHHAPDSSGTATANLLVTEAAKLIHSQQKLIEGQRKLIEEQSKLIHEKSKLIDLENRALDQQTEMALEQ